MDSITTTTTLQLPERAHSLRKGTQDTLADDLFLTMMALYESGMSYQNCIFIACDKTYATILRFLADQRDEESGLPLYTFDQQMLLTLDWGKPIYERARDRFYLHVQAEEAVKDALVAQQE